jgi:hypothetical protein
MRRMRHWLAILFMMFLPLQLSWAAVSAYCQHESGAAANHLGHHEHQHKAAAGDDSGTKAKGSHFDCGFCQAASCTALPNGVGSTAAVVLATLALAPPPMGQLIGHPSEPERPKWSHPA